jgi:hypothetical protein
MQDALETSHHVIAIYSPDYFKSEFASVEAFSAFVQDPAGLKRNLIPVRVRPCEPPVMFRSRIYIDLVGKSDLQARKDLLAGVSAAVTTDAETNLLRFAAPPPFPPKLAAKAEREAPVPSGPRPGGGPPTLLYVGMDIGRGLGLREQFAGMRKILGRARAKKKLKVVGCFDATAEALPDLLNEHLPTIVHFSGNQSGGRVLLRSSAGGVTTIPANALAGLLKSLDGAVSLAIVDTCDSLPCARSIIGSVEFAMGVRGKPYDEDATAFYAAFYRALAAGRSLEAAVGQALASHRFRRVSRKETPELCVRKGADPAAWTLSRLAASGGRVTGSGSA